MIHVLIRILLSSLLIAASAIPICVTAQNLLQNVAGIEQIPAELMAYAPNGVRPGQTVWIGLQLRHPPKWHTYWKNPGDSGLPTTFQWTLPAGVDAGDMAWPVPKRLPVADMINYGYDGTVLLPVPLTITPDFNPSSSSLDAFVVWLCFGCSLDLKIFFILLKSMFTSSLIFSLESVVSFFISFSSFILDL